MDYTVVFLCARKRQKQTKRQLDPNSDLSETPTQTAESSRDTSVLVGRLDFVPNDSGILLLSQMQLKMLKPMGVYVGVVGLEQIVQSSKPNRHADING